MAQQAPSPATPNRVDPMDWTQGCLPRCGSRTAYLGPCRSAQVFGPRMLREAVDACPEGLGVVRRLRAASEDGPFAFDLDRNDDGPGAGALLAPSPGHSLVALVSTPPRATAVPSMDEIEARMRIPRATDADPQRRAKAS